MHTARATPASEGESYHCANCGRPGATIERHYREGLGDSLSPAGGPEATVWVTDYICQDCQDEIDADWQIRHARSLQTGEWEGVPEKDLEW